VEQGLLSGRVYGFVETGDGDYWFATGLGLSRFREGKWTHWTITSGLAKSRVFCVAAESDNRVWFGHTTGIAGLGYIDEQDRVRYLNKVDGLVGDNVRELEFDKDGRLWITTETGLGVYDGGLFSSFQRPEGLAHTNLWPVLAMDGYIIIGTVGGGVHSLSLDELSNPPPRVHVSSTPHDSGARVEWTTIAHRGALAPDRIETRYRHYGGEWSPWNRTRVVELENLSSGDHEFTVQAKGILGKIDPAGVITQFHVPSPFYLHPAFIAVVLLLGLGAMTGLWGSAKRRLYQRRLLERSEERNRTLVEQLPICIHELDLRGQVLSMNPAGLRMLELERESDIVGADYLSLIADEDRERVRALFQQSLGGVVTEFEFGAFINGMQRRFETALEPLRGEDGSIVRLMGYSIDTTEREKAEADSRLLEKRLEDAKKMQAVAVLAGGVAHDFNNLLTIIGGHAAMINAGPDKSDSVSKSSVEILKAQERAAGLTRQLLTLGRRQPSKPVLIDLRQVVRGIEEMLQRLVGDQIKFSMELAPAECMVLADPGQMEQVLINLVVNARDAMPSGGSLEVACGPVALDSAETIGGSSIEAGGYVVLSVQDSGIGLDESTRARIFELFFTTKGLEKGTGLGLSTIHAVVEEHAGRIIVESEVGAGSCFSIFLPVSAERLVEIPTPVSRGEIQGGEETLLLVDDDPPIRQLVQNSLESLGYRVISAKDGVEALELAERAEHPIHLLLTDVIMPRMCGRSLAAAFAERFPRTKVVFMTGYADAPDWKPTAPVLAKPFRPEELAALVRTTLDAVESSPLA
jgi:PAS domain S-box-containing protein